MRTGRVSYALPSAATVQSVPLDPRCPALSRIRFFLGIGGTVKCGMRISECGMGDGRKRHELHEFSRKEGLIEPSGRYAAKPAPIQMRNAERGVRNGGRKEETRITRIVTKGRLD